MKKQIRVTRRAATIKSAIRDVIVPAKKLERQGKEIIYLNIGDPVRYFDTPPHIKDALTQAVMDGLNWYSSSEGLDELRQVICEKERRVTGVTLSPDDVIVTSGVSEAMMFSTAAIVEKGDEVLVPDPNYPPCTSYIKFFEGEPIPYRTDEENGWQPDTDNLRSVIKKKTRALVVINPNNPCSAVYSERTIKEIVDIAGEYDLLVISDEIYNRIFYEEKPTSTAKVAMDVPVIGLNGFSKTYLMTGWRLGYMYFHDPEGKAEELKEGIKKQGRIRTSPNTPVQKAGIEALRGPEDHIKEMVEKLRKRRDYVVKRVNEIDGLSSAKPKGAFYIFPKVDGIGSIWKNDQQFVLDLLHSKGVLVVHGSGFGKQYGSGHFRAIFLPPINVLEKSFNKIDQFIKEH